MEQQNLLIRLHPLMLKKDATSFEANLRNSNIQISQELYNSLMALIQQSSCQTPALNHISTSQINSAKSSEFSSH